jgi:hypothetical protein
VRLSAHPGPTFVSSAREDVEQLALKAALSSLVHEIRAVRDDRVGLARLLSAGAGEEILRPGVPTRDGPTVERYFSSRARRILQSAVREHLGVLEQFDRALALLG